METLGWAVPWEQGPTTTRLEDEKVGVDRIVAPVNRECMRMPPPLRPSDRIKSIRVIRLKRTSEDTYDTMVCRAKNEAADQHRAEGFKYNNSELISYTVRKHQEYDFVIEVT